jgi:predicted regulator of amino acid metabolism with ACT domain
MVFKFSTGKTVENTYSTDYSPKQYISSQVNSIEVPSPQIDSQTTINRHVVRNGVNLDEMATLIDKRNSMDYPRDLSNSISST